MQPSLRNKDIFMVLAVKWKSRIHFEWYFSEIDLPKLGPVGMNFTRSPPTSGFQDVERKDVYLVNICNLINIIKKFMCNLRIQIFPSFYMFIKTSNNHAHILKRTEPLENSLISL